MGHEAIRPAFGGEVRPVDFVGHDRLLPHRWTGTVRLRWKIDPAHPVAVGAGWHRLEKTDASRLVVAEIVRTGDRGKPVLPGSSLKGAIRQVYELLTPSCRIEMGRKKDRTCPFPPKKSFPRVCPACSLFGAAGLAGRLAFGEASPEDDDWSRNLRIVPTPAGWGKQQAPWSTLRVYDLKKAVMKDGRPCQEDERTWTVAGRFLSRLRLVNASEEELGILFAALGFGAGTAGPMVRLGGNKYHGLGAAEVEAVEVRQSYSESRRLTDQEANRFAMESAERALRLPERRTAWEALHRAISTE